MPYVVRTRKRHNLVSTYKFFGVLTEALEHAMCMTSVVPVYRDAHRVICLNQGVFTAENSMYTCEIEYVLCETGSIEAQVYELFGRLGALEQHVVKH
jgi:hypothetical protein